MSKEYLRVSGNVEEEEDVEEEEEEEEEEDAKKKYEEENAEDDDQEEDPEVINNEYQNYYFENEQHYNNEVSREDPGKYLKIENEEYLNISPDDNDKNKYIKIGIYFCFNYEDNDDVIYDHNFKRKKNEYEIKYKYKKKYGCSEEKFDFIWPFDPIEIFSHPYKLFDLDPETNKPKFNIPEILNDFLKKNKIYKNNKKIKIMFFNEGLTGPKGDSGDEKGPGVIEENPFAIYGFENVIEPNNTPDPVSDSAFDPFINAGVYLCDDNGEELIEFVYDNEYIRNTAVQIGLVYKPYNDILIFQNPDREKSEYPKIQSIFAMTTDDYEKYIINRRRNIKENNKKIIEKYKEQNENERKKKEEDAEAERKKIKEEKEKKQNIKREKWRRIKEEREAISKRNVEILKQKVGVIQNLFTKNNKKKGEEMLKRIAEENRKREEEEREAAKNNKGNEFKGGKRIRRKTIKRKTKKHKTHKRIKHIKRKTIKRIKRKTHRRRH
jgi:hypothetical protein